MRNPCGLTPRVFATMPMSWKSSEQAGIAQIPFNISTTSALVTAAGGVKVTKHGNRAASSKCGAADVLESLGVNIMLEPEHMERVFDETDIAFMHAQVYHRSMQYVAPVRRALGCHTVFNILGPLTNPAFNNMQIMGVYSDHLLIPMAEVLMMLGVRDGMVVFGNDVMDEVSMSDSPASVNFMTALMNVIR